MKCSGGSPALTTGGNCCPLHSRAMARGGKSSGSNTSNGGTHQCCSQILLPHVKEKVVVLRHGETTELHRVKQQPKEKAGGEEKTKEERR